jgi:hypothetical protein
MPLQTGTDPEPMVVIAWAQAWTVGHIVVRSVVCLAGDGDYQIAQLLASPCKFRETRKGMSVTVTVTVTDSVTDSVSVSVSVGVGVGVGVSGRTQSQPFASAGSSWPMWRSPMGDG